MEQLDLALDLRDTSRRIRLARRLRVAPSPDGRGLMIHSAEPELWISTAVACAETGLDRDRLYELGREGEIEGRQPNKPIADIEAGRPTNHKWEWLSTSVEAYRRRHEDAVMAARI